ncbi:hypothetical protein [Streptomyces sp. PsTaAH-124]|uniref:hypothetical protein n=1 Tax=Streptomyces sp. PsTaAH-124 TaxID=1157638 RepID=UPI00131A2966|nr:hypothetical protein [Streptomyces sp. PsTaAH-124]
MTRGPLAPSAPPIPPAPPARPVAAVSGPRPAGSRRIRVTVAVGLTALATVLSLGAGLTARQWWDGDAYPVADPAVTADRLDARAQEVYAALALPDAELDDAPTSSPRRRAESDCPYTGLSHLADQFSDTPPNMPGVVTVSSRWTLKNVPGSAGQSALRRAATELRRQGWDVTENATADQRTTLRTVPPGGGATLYARALPGGRLAVSAAAECARYPENTPTGADGNPELPPQRLPDGLRR